MRVTLKCESHVRCMNLAGMFFQCIVCFWPYFIETVIEPESSGWLMKYSIEIAVIQVCQLVYSPLNFRT